MSTTSSSSPALTHSDDYPYPVTQNIANFVSLRLSSTNFLLWKTQMLNILENYDLQGFINGEVQPLPQFINNADSGTQTNPAFVKWRKTDRLVKGWLTATFSEEVLGIAVGLNTAFEVWNALVHAFARVSSNRSLALKQRLTSITRGTNTLAVYLRWFKAVCDDLAAIGKPIPDHKKSRWLLNGLGKEYEVFTTTMLRPLVLPYSEIVTLLEKWEIDPRNDSPPSYSTPLSAFAPLESQDITSQLYHQMHHNSSSTETPTVIISSPSLSEPCQASYSDPPVETTPIPPETNPT
nr:hypothetical protein CFP56_52053 [Quercus suber]